MEYSVLGELEVRRNGDVLDVGTFRQRALLALLLTAPNQVFSTDRIIDGLWGDEGEDKQNALWVHISGIRKALEPEREKRTDGTILLTRSPGYLVSVEPDAVDSVRFERLVAEGRALAETDPASASLVLGEALALWRGHAFEEFTYEPFAQAEIARLEGLRLEAIEARIGADLQRGMDRELISELEALVRQHPLQEAFTAQLMLALYRSGRQADALRTYTLLKGRLGEELGIEPSSRLVRLEEQIVTGEADLESGARRAGLRSGPEPGLSVRGYELREQLGVGEFGVVYRAFQATVGREVAIKVIRPELANDPAFIRRFEAEAQLVARLEHPHIVPLYDYWREPDAAYLVMRLMKSGSLSDLLEVQGLTPTHAARMADQLGAALQTAHRAGIAHRDVKPSNILLDEDGNAYLSDFGIAKDVDGTVEPNPSSDVYRLGVVMAQALTGLPGSVSEIRGALAPAALRVIDRATSADAENRYEQVGDFVAELGEALDATQELELLEELDNPYKGLRAFGAADTGDFFGRARLIDRLLARLGEAGSRGRFVALVGPSGSGKSSVVRAGILPALRLGALPTSDVWYVVEMTPAPHPFENLEEALLGIAVDPPQSLLELLSGGEDGIRRAVRRLIPQDGSQLLIVIDQFEELFTQVDDAVARRFLDTLVDAVREPASGIRVLTTLRADFYDPPLRHRGLGELLRDGTEVITPMTPEELTSAITGPTDRLGVTFEPALVAELVNDVADRSGALPLLQYTLTELFDARQGARITREAYSELGGVSGALAKRADGLLSNLGDDSIDVTRQVFLRLVTLGEGADDTRRRVLRAELEQLEVDRRVLDDVLDSFGRHRLLSFDRDPVTRGPTVEISHEALLTEWGRLRKWIDSARHDVRSQRRLAVAMNEWESAGQTDEYLIRSGLLDQLDAWAGGTSLPLSTPERTFLEASVAERDRAQTEEREREARADEAERQAQRRFRQLVGAGAIAIVVGALAVFGILQWRSASDARDEAEAARDESESLVTAEEYRAASDAALTSDPELSLLLAVEAIRATSELGFATEEAIDSLHWALQQLGVHYPVGADAQATVRSGPTGLTGVFVLPPAELVALAEGSTERRLTGDECITATGLECPAPTPVEPDLPLRFGVENYKVNIPEVLPGVPAFGTGPLAGTRVTFAGVATIEDSPGLRAELDRFTELTGIEVDVLSNSDFDLTASLATGQVASFPDIAGFFQPPAQWARARAIDLTMFLDEDTLRADFGDYLLDLAASNGTQLRGLPMNMQPKGLVYYPKEAFDAAGYEVPTSWDELVTLSEKMVADGHTPWCFQWEAGFASGFPGSDFLESLFIRVGGLDKYDEWTAGLRPFTDPEMLEAARLGEELLFTPGFVRSGSSSISQEFFGAVNTRLLEIDPFTGEQGPQCWLVHQISQMADLLGSDTELGPAGRLGVDVDFFILPPVAESEDAPVIGAGQFVTAMTDRPEIRALMEHMASPSWGRVWAGSEGQGDTFISANHRFDTAAYAGIVGPETGRTLPLDPAKADVRIRMHGVQRSALDAGTWRFDASDLMPATFGAWTEEFVPGPFWQGMIDWVDQVKPIEEILADIEAARPPPGT